MAANVPIVVLQKNKPYQITRFNEWGDNILLYLRGYEEDAQEIVTSTAHVLGIQKCGS